MTFDTTFRPEGRQRYDGCMPCRWWTVGPTRQDKNCVPPSSTIRTRPGNGQTSAQRPLRARVFQRAAILAATAVWALGCSHQPPRSPAPGDAVRSRRDAAGIAQVLVPPGSFLMGTDDATLDALKALDPPSWAARAFASERPQHTVRLTRSFWIDTYEVTNQAFQAFVDKGVYRMQEYWSAPGRIWLSRQNPDALPLTCPGEGPSLPRRCITWYEAEAYATWRGGHLPTEAEWEFAARGPGARRYPWGDAFDAARCNVVGSTGATAVGSFPGGVSWVGAHDMAGNAMEWVQDWLDTGYYQHAAHDDPTGPATGTVKVEKGGWWGSNPFVARSAYRHYEDPPEYGDAHIGFRVVTPQ